MIKKYVLSKIIYKCEILDDECGDYCYLLTERPDCEECTVYSNWKREKDSTDNHATQELGSEDKPEKGQALGFESGNESGLS